MNRPTPIASKHDKLIVRIAFFVCDYFDSHFFFCSTM